MNIADFYEDGVFQEEKLGELIEELMSEEHNELQSSYVLLYNLEEAEKLAKKIAEHPSGGSRACARMARLYFSSLSIMEEGLINNAIDELARIVQPSNKFLNHASAEDIDAEVKILVDQINQETAPLFTKVLAQFKDNAFAEAYSLLSF